MASQPPKDDAILFRPNKKRKIYRQRPTENIDKEQAASAPQAQSLDELITDAANIEATNLPMAEILRLRKRNKKIGGVEFRADSYGQVSRNEEGSLIVRQKGEDGQPLEAVGSVEKRFASQTGTVGDVNKHMMAYIDSELAKRRDKELQILDATTITTSQPVPSSSVSVGNSGGDSKAGADVQRQPAAIGKLQEVDLGDEARNKNRERTDKARRNLDGEEADEDDGASGKKTKVRLGRDGKPWRGRKRRGSEDIKRDKLVEDILRENRLEIFEAPAIETATINDDQAADDRIAEEFRREFMDAVSQRQRKKTGPPAPPARTAAEKKAQEELKGPKLGGSRNQRAAMLKSRMK